MRVKIIDAYLISLRPENEAENALIQEWCKSGVSVRRASSSVESTEYIQTHNINLAFEETETEKGK